MLASATITNTIRYIKLQQYAKIHIVQNKNTSRHLHRIAMSHVQHISELHSKFALMPHHVWKYGRHPFSDPRIGEEKKKKEEETTGVTI